MQNFPDKTDSRSTLKRKGFFALGAVIFAALWIAAAFLFPMEWFAIFFDFTLGSYISLAIISAVISCVFTWLLTLITRLDISALLMFVSSLVFQIGMFFLFSAFRLSMPYLWIITAVVHALITALIFLKAKPVEAPTTKRIKTEKPPVTLRFKTAAAVIGSVISDALYILLAYIFAFSFYHLY